MEIYEVLYADWISNCDPGDVIQFPWTDEDGETFIEQVTIHDIDVDSTIVMIATSDITGDKTTYEFTYDCKVWVLGG